MPLKCLVNFKKGLILGACQMKKKITQLNKTVQNSKKLQVTIFPKLLFSSIIFYYHRYCFVRLPLHYKYLRYIRILIVNTCLPAWNDMIGLWIWPMEAYDWTTTDSAGVPQFYTNITNTLPEYCKLHKNSSVGSVYVCVCETKGIATRITEISHSCTLRREINTHNK